MNDKKEAITISEEMKPYVFTYIRTVRNDWGLLKTFQTYSEAFIMALATKSQVPPISADALRKRFDESDTPSKEVKDVVLNILKDDDIVRYYDISINGFPINYLAITNGVLEDRNIDFSNPCAVEYSFTNDENKMTDGLIVVGMKHPALNASRINHVVKHELVHVVQAMLKNEHFGDGDWVDIVNHIDKEIVSVIDEFLADYIPFDKLTMPSGKNNKTPVDDFREWMTTCIQPEVVTEYEQILDIIQPLYNNQDPVESK